MKAVRLYGYGDVNQLRYEESPTPHAAEDQVLVKVRAAAINPVDWKIREGALKDRMPLQFPATLGRDASGVVESAGKAAGKFKQGDKVMGLVNNAYAEYLAAPASALAFVPAGMDLAEAAAIPLVTTTGAQLIERGVKPTAGQTVLVTGAAGMVGRTAVFVAKQHGARVIAGVRRNQKEEAQGLGADSVVALDDDREVEALPEVDAIADTVGGETIRKLARKIKKSGVLASVLGKPQGLERADIQVNEVWAQPDADRLQQLAQDVQSGALQIPIGKKFPLSEAAEAQKAAQEGSPGKVLLIAEQS